MQGFTHDKHPINASSYYYLCYHPHCLLLREGTTQGAVLLRGSAPGRHSPDLLPGSSSRGPERVGVPSPKLGSPT